MPNRVERKKAPNIMQEDRNKFRVCNEIVIHFLSNCRELARAGSDNDSISHSGYTKSYFIDLPQMLAAPVWWQALWSKQWQVRLQWGNQFYARASQPRRHTEIHRWRNVERLPRRRSGRRRSRFRGFLLRRCRFRWRRFRASGRRRYRSSRPSGVTGSGPRLTEQRKRSVRGHRNCKRDHTITAIRSPAL